MASIPVGEAHILAPIDPRTSISARFGMTIGSVAFVTALLVSLVVGASVRRQVERDIGSALGEQAYQMADKLDRGMFERYRDIQSLASLPTFHDPRVTPAAQRQQLEALQQTYPDYTWLGLTDPHGKVMVSTGGILTGADVAGRAYFRQGQRAPYVGDVHAAFLLGKLIPQNGNGPLRLLDLAAPVRATHGLTGGVIVAHLNWQWADEVRQSLIGPTQAHTQSEIAIVNRDGQVLLAPASAPFSETLALHSVAQAQQRQRGYIVETWPDGVAYLTGFAPSTGYRNYPGLGWTVLVRQRADLAFAPARQLQWNIMLLGLLAGIVAACGGWLAVGRMLRPLLAMTLAADQIRQGQSAAVLPEQRGGDEIARLAGSFRTMIATLQRQERVLQTQNDQLLHELAERKRTEAALAEAVHVRDQFMTTASHELKTPLTSLLGYAEMMQRRLEPNPTIEARDQRAMEVIVHQAERLNNLISAMLDLASVQRHALVLASAPIDLAPLVQQLVDETRPLLTRHTLACQAVPAWIMGDPLRIGQVLNNLLQNAIKYSPEGGAITVRLTCHGDRAVLAVSDQGIGVPQDAQVALFERFYRAANVDAEQISGFGIGLYVVQEIVRLHQGTIHVASEEGHGSTFTVVLPLYAGPG